MYPKLALRKLSFCLLLAGICIQGCVEPYNPGLVGQERQLVVEGNISDNIADNVVNLTYTAGYNSEESVFSIRVRGAEVWTTNQNNVRTNWQDDGVGNFRPLSGFNPVIGETYTLHIKTTDGSLYESNPQRLTKAPEIVNANYQYRAVPGKARGVFPVEISFKDDATEDNYYQVAWKHYQLVDECGVVVSPGEGRIKPRYPCCTPCWNIDFSFGEINLSSDRFVQPGATIQQFVSNVPFDSDSPYYLSVELTTINKEAYTYLKLLKEQTQNTGSTFDLPPAPVRGNIFKITNGGKESALGYFKVGGVSRKVVYVRRDNAPVAAPINEPSYYLVNECRPCQELPTRTALRPVGWVN